VGSWSLDKGKENHLGEGVRHIAEGFEKVGLLKKIARTVDGAFRATRGIGMLTEDSSLAALGGRGMAAAEAVGAGFGPFGTVASGLKVASSSIKAVHTGQGTDVALAVAAAGTFGGESLADARFIAGLMGVKLPREVGLAGNILSAFGLVGMGVAWSVEAYRERADVQSKRQDAQALWGTALALAYSVNPLELDANGVPIPGTAAVQLVVEARKAANLAIKTAKEAEEINRKRDWKIVAATSKLVAAAVIITVVVCTILAMAFGVALLANPYSLIILGIIGAAAALLEVVKSIASLWSKAEGIKFVATDDQALLAAAQNARDQVNVGWIEARDTARAAADAAVQPPPAADGASSPAGGGAAAPSAAAEASATMAAPQADLIAQKNRIDLEITARNLEARFAPHDQISARMLQQIFATQLAIDPAA
jgi:F0F1-type ATP synthase assembly protein I